MGIRESLNKNPGLTTGITAAVIGIAIIYILWGVVFSGPSTANAPSQAYYTVDDGKNWFTDDINKAVPFTKDGAEAVRVHLYTCDEGKTRIPVYMEKYTDNGKKIFEEMNKPNTTPNPGAIMAAQDKLMRETLIKKPGDAKWYRQQNPGSGAVLAQNICAGKETATGPVEVFPD